MEAVMCGAIRGHAARRWRVRPQSSMLVLLVAATFLLSSSYSSIAMRVGADAPPLQCSSAERVLHQCSRLPCSDQNI